MTYKWKKLGQIFEGKYSCAEMASHASNPCVLPLTGDSFRVYYSGRDKIQRSSIGCADFKIEKEVVTLQHISECPILTPGQAGAFDDSGASMACILKEEGKFWLYYLGWNLGVTVPWRNSIGLATSDDGIHFERVQAAPIFDRNKYDPFSISYPWVLKEQNVWHMWYGSNLRWGREQRDMDHLIKYASSKNGIDWVPSGEISINFKDNSEYAISKPCVMKEGDIYKMWYSYRGDNYRIGYAESTNAIHFTRQDASVGIDVSRADWDSQSIEYPCVFDMGGERYMLYNGNKYGLTGFGIAKLEIE